MDLPLERRALDELHRDVVDPVGAIFSIVVREWNVGLPDLVNGDDVGMVERRGGTRLLNESPQPLIVLHDLVGQDLQRDRPLQRGVVRLVNLSHPTGPERPDDPVMRNRGAWIDRHSSVELHDVLWHPL